MPKLEVHKFGGASLADAAAYRHAAEIVRARPGRHAVVCSAPAGVTDALLGLASAAARGEGYRLPRGVEDLRARFARVAAAAVPAVARTQTMRVIDAACDELRSLLESVAVLRELTPRTSDLCISRGERLSAAIFAATLGRRARLVDATELVVTDGHFGNASPDLRATDRAVRRVLGPLLGRGRVPVVPGFLGATPSGAVATLGRGGSDLTATLLGRALGAERVNLWKDVPGLLTADPRVVPDARVIPQLHAREAAELAYYGAKVLHPRALIPLGGRRVPVIVRPFTEPAAAGTEVSTRRSRDEHPVKALSAMRAQALVTIAGNGMLGVPGVAARAFGALEQAGISVSLITQASSEQSICFTVPEAAAAAATESLRRAFARETQAGLIESIAARAGLATIAVVGLGMAGRPGIAARVFGALAAARVNVVAIAQGSSELNISFVIPDADAAVAQRRIHDTFQLAKIGGGAAERSDHADVILLGLGRIGRALAAELAKDRRVARRLRVVGLLDSSGAITDVAGISPSSLSAIARGKERGVSLARLPGGRRTSPAAAIADLGRHALDSPIVVDLTADETAPVLRAALESGMDLVLANKRPLAGSARDAGRLHALAASHGRRIRSEATVGAGLPILDTYQKLVESGDRVLSIEGCLSGTLGFLFAELEAGRSFSVALRAAMDAGLTEPDPRDDLSGADVGRKALILARLLGFRGEPSDVVVESLVPPALRRVSVDVLVTRLGELDAPWQRRVEAARVRGGVLRYVARVSARRAKVGIVTAPLGTPFAGLRGPDNQVAFTTTRYRQHPLVITGPGAGPAVTAAGVLNDLLDLAPSRAR